MQQLHYYLEKMNSVCPYGIFIPMLIVVFILHNSQEKEKKKIFVFIDYWEDNKHVVHIYNRVLLRHKNNKIQSFMTVKMGLEVMVVKEYRLRQV